jgi:hypothetical protein
MNATKETTMSSLQDAAAQSGPAARGSLGVERDEGHLLLRRVQYASEATP